MSGTYDAHLVALSVVVAIVASYTALEIAGRRGVGQDRWSWLWLAGGATSLGVGIWSMHFIGMLAFRLPIPMAYDLPVTLLSLAIAIVVSGYALYTMRRPEIGPASLSLSAALMGIGIASMHYTGMLAMSMDPPIGYDPGLFVASVLIAIVASMAALWLAFKLREKDSGMAMLSRLGSAVVMGLAISGMHYTGMSAAVFHPESVCTATGLAASIDDDGLAVAVGIASIVILLATLGIAAINAHVVHRTSSMAAALQAANDQLRMAALYDALTGLPNRTLLADRSQQALLHASRNNARFALLFIDLDRFKPVNDNFGHQVGDLLLVQVAARLLAAVRKEDTVARAGGDEFVVLLAHVAHGAGVQSVCEKIVDELARSFQVRNHVLEISCSIGASIYPDHGADLATLMANADAAMYQAKGAGRRGYRFFEPVQMHPIGQSPS